MHATKVTALLGLCAVSAMASDVYTTFYNSNGAISPNFDVSNNGCFSIPSPTSFSVNQNADGPYCLDAYTAGGCSGSLTQQTAQSLSEGVSYSLDPGVADAASYKWNLGACNGS